MLKHVESIFTLDRHVSARLSSAHVLQSYNNTFPNLKLNKPKVLLHISPPLKGPIMLFLEKVLLIFTERQFQNRLDKLSYHGPYLPRFAHKGNSIHSTIRRVLSPDPFALEELFMWITLHQMFW
ncbi:hypothetical protein NPIL_273761 [Nephila pilipes]|uniref:Uncharacterized protein n=1 Tax=Nephila pilipes TaxID=299642 RepID=A0A8X6Q4H0_NEPPI|nr:hypothetical protein NPIL_273761 [Nephila pilipes]